MIKYEDIQKANEAIRTMTISRTDKKTGKTINKEYAEVNQRIKAFRMVYPEGFIGTEMLSNENGVCIFEARVGVIRENGEPNVLGIGHAYEKESSSYINQTSYIENCETSAVGRALGMAGFGIDTSVASYEEVQNAMNNQIANEQIDSVKANALIKRCENEKVSPEKIAALYHVKNVFGLTEKMYSNINVHWEEVKERCKA